MIAIFTNTFNLIGKIKNIIEKIDNRLYDLIYDDWLIGLLASKLCKCCYNPDTYILYSVHPSQTTSINSASLPPSKAIYNVIRDLATLLVFSSYFKTDIIDKIYILFSIFLRISYIMYRFFSLLIKNK